MTNQFKLAPLLVVVLIACVANAVAAQGNEDVNCDPLLTAVKPLPDALKSLLQQFGFIDVAIGAADMGALRLEFALDYREPLIVPAVSLRTMGSLMLIATANPKDLNVTIQQRSAFKLRTLKTLGAGKSLALVRPIALWSPRDEYEVQLEMINTIVAFSLFPDVHLLRVDADLEPQQNVFVTESRARGMNSRDILQSLKFEREPYVETYLGLRRRHRRLVEFKPREFRVENYYEVPSPLITIGRWRRPLEASSPR